MAIIQRIYTQSELVELVERVHGTAKSKGWWPETPEGNFADGDLEDKLVLIASELCEAFEEYRKPEVDITRVYSLVWVHDLAWAPSEGVTDDGGIASVRAVRKVVDYVPGRKPEGFPIEMADAYIRTLDLLGGLGTVPHPLEIFDIGDEPWKKPGKHLFKILGYLPKVPGDPPRFLSHVLGAIEVCCGDLGIDLKSAINLKMAYNATRPERHGGKRA